MAGYLYNPKLELGAAYDEAMRKKIFEPLEMKSTTFDYARALKGNHATPHSDDVDGKQMVASMDLNYSIHPHRPAGGVWTSAHDLIRYVQLELAKGKLPNGKVLVSETNLLARRKPYVKVGAYGSYGMGLQVENRWGTPVVSHGGSMFGFKSDIMFLPEHGVGAVILTNADTGGLMLGSFRRRFLEVLFDGKPEAAEDLAKAAENYQSSSSQVPRAPGCACGRGGRQADWLLVTQVPSWASLRFAARDLPPSSISASGAAQWLPAKTTTARSPS